MSATSTHTANAKEKLVSELAFVSNSAQDAVLSGGWSYPLRGIIYALTHPSLFRSSAPILLKSLLVSLAIIVVFFTFTYLPQAAFLTLFSGPLGFATAVPLVLGEAYAVITLVGKVFFLGKAQNDIFDAVLIQRGHERLVARDRPVHQTASGLKKLGTSVTKIDRLSKDGIIRYLLSLPLNGIPVVGTVFFLFYNGIKAGPSFHARYFHLKGFNDESRAQFVHNRRGPYTAFGTTALALNLVPLAGLVFGFTSAAGAALWAADLEDVANKKSTEGVHAPEKVTRQEEEGAGVSGVRKEFQNAQSGSVRDEVRVEM